MTPEEVREARSSRSYRKLRRAFLNEHPLCQACVEEGFTVAAVEIDHIVPVSRAPDRFWDTTNWAGLCRAHHEAKTAAENRQDTPGRVAWRERLESMFDLVL